MNIVNRHPSSTHKMDCCLVTRFPTALSGLGLHKDLDKLTCQESSLCTVSFGAPRELTCIYDGKLTPNGEVDSTPDIILPATDKTMNVMKPGAQQVMKHAVRPGVVIPGGSNVRYSLSFRKIACDLPVPETSGDSSPLQSMSNECPQHNPNQHASAPTHLIIGDSLV